MPTQYNLFNLPDLFPNITKFVIVGCRQLKVLKKTARVGVFNSQGTHNTATVTQTCSIEIAV